MVEVLEGFKHRRFVPDLGHAGIQRRLTRTFKKYELVDEQTAHNRPGDAVEGVAALLPAFHGFALACPEIGRQGQRAGIQQVAVFKGFVVLVVVCRQAQSAGFDAHVDVLGHQHYLTRGLVFAQRFNHTEDLVVSLALWQAHGQGVVQRLGLKEQAAAGFAVPCGVKLQSLRNFSVFGTGQCVQRAAGLAGVAGHLGHAFFVTVEFFQHDHRQKDVVLFKPEQTHGVVHQHIGVEHEEFGRAGVFGFFEPSHWRCATSTLFLIGRQAGLFWTSRLFGLKSNRWGVRCGLNSRRGDAGCGVWVLAGRSQRG